MQFFACYVHFEPRLSLFDGKLISSRKSTEPPNPGRRTELVMATHVWLGGVQLTRFFRGEYFMCTRALCVAKIRCTPPESQDMREIRLSAARSAAKI